VYKKRSKHAYAYTPFPSTMNPSLDACADPSISTDILTGTRYASSRIVRRQSSLTSGYTTTDDFGSDGDDTPHLPIPSYPQPHYFSANVSLPSNGTAPATVDLVFLDYFAAALVADLVGLGGNYSVATDVRDYMPSTFSTQDYLPAYVKVAPGGWRGLANCTVSLS